MNNFSTKTKRYLLDKVLLSVFRLLPYLAGILGLNEIIAATHPFNGFTNFAPVFGFDSDPTTVIIGTLVFIGIAYYLWTEAEKYLDPERRAHRHAYEQTAPKLQAEKDDLTEKLKEAHTNITKLTRELETERTQHATQKTASQNAIAELAKTQTTLEKTQAKLSKTENELFEALQEAKAARAQREEAESEAATSQAVALKQLLNELDNVQDNLAEFRSQVNAKYQNALTYGVMEETAAPPKLIKPVSPTPPESIRVHNGPKTNYLK